MTKEDIFFSPTIPWLSKINSRNIFMNLIYNRCNVKVLSHQLSITELGRYLAFFLKNLRRQHISTSERGWVHFVVYIDFKLDMYTTRSRINGLKVKRLPCDLKVLGSIFGGAVDERCWGASNEDETPTRRLLVFSGCLTKVCSWYNLKQRYITIATVLKYL